jgi:hypothetical protein
MRRLLALVPCLALACSASKSAGEPLADASSDALALDTATPGDAPGADATSDSDPGFLVDGAPLDGPTPTDAPAGCVSTAKPAASSEVVLSAAYATAYTAYELGVVPGLPATLHLGGCVVDANDPNALLVAGASEDAAGAIYRIAIDRDACGHVVGWKGTATKLATTPYVDANLLYLGSGAILYTEWPQNKIGQLLPGGATPAIETDLATVGIPSSPGGAGFVPPTLAGAGGLRLLSWPGGEWSHQPYAKSPTNAALLAFTSSTKATTLPNGPGGFAYVPAGSPQFAAQSVIVSEWSNDTVATYEVDAQGDPQVATRKPFFTKFPKPWGAYFDRVTGDFLFLTWTAVPDRVFSVQGFSKPPPPPPPPM